LRATYHPIYNELISHRSSFFDTSYPIVAILGDFSGAKFSAEPSTNLSIVVILKAKHSEIFESRIGIVLINMMDLYIFAGLIADAARVIVFKKYLSSYWFWDWCSHIKPVFRCL
jgi:hypothetical protein